jgi:hypothetical protein
MIVAPNKRVFFPHITLHPFPNHDNSASHSRTSTVLGSSAPRATVYPSTKRTSNAVRAVVSPIVVAS